MLTHPADLLALGATALLLADLRGGERLQALTGPLTGVLLAGYFFAHGVPVAGYVALCLAFFSVCYWFGLLARFVGMVAVMVWAAYWHGAFLEEIEQVPPVIYFVSMFAREEATETGGITPLLFLLMASALWLILAHELSLWGFFVFQLLVMARLLYLLANRQQRLPHGVLERLFV